jgi:hypothetical protein
MTESETALNPAVPTSAHGHHTPAAKTARVTALDLEDLRNHTSAAMLALAALPGSLQFPEDLLDNMSTLSSGLSAIDGFLSRFAQQIEESEEVING